METIHGLNTNGPAIIGTGVAFTVLATVGVGLRFGSKRLAHNPFGIDDWLLLFALVCYFATEIWFSADIIGREASSPDDDLYKTYLKYIYVYSVFYWTIIPLVEVSILIFYRRVFFPSSFRWISAILIAICTGWFIAGIIIEIGYPGYSIDYWFPGSAHTHWNLDYLKFWLVMGIIEVTLEVIILILPIRELYHLQLSAEKRMLCSLIFAMGSFVVITGIVRIIKVYKPSGAEVDLTQGDIWLNVHLGTAIICACLPTYRPLVSRNPWFSKSFSGGHSKEHSAGSGKTFKLPSLPKSSRRGESSEVVTKIYCGQQGESHGNFADARRSESSNATKTEWLDESAVRTGDAIKVKQSVEVV